MSTAFSEPIFTKYLNAQRNYVQISVPAFTYRRQ